MIFRRAVLLLIVLPWMLLLSAAQANMPGTFQPPLNVGGNPIVTYQTSSAQTVAATTFNFTSMAFGTPDVARNIIVAVTGTAAAAGMAISSATIGGLTATVQVQVSGATRGFAAILTAPLQSGTSGTVSITFNQSFVRAAIGVWAAYNLSSITPTATNSVAVASGVQTLNVNVSALGLVVACTYDNGDTLNPSVSWSGATQRYSLGAAGDGNSGADFTEGAAGETPRSISATWTTSSRGAGAVAAFR